MLPPLLFWTLLLGTMGLAMARGSGEERLAAAICVAATLATKLLVSPVARRYSGMEIGVFLVDLGMLAGFTAIALRSVRFWPLWLAGLQLTTCISHLLKAVRLELMPEAYAAASRFWSYPVLLILIAASLRTPRYQSISRRAAA